MDELLELLELALHDATKEMALEAQTHRAFDRHRIADIDQALADLLESLRCGVETVRRKRKG